MLQNNAMVNISSARTYLNNSDSSIEPSLILCINSLSDVFDTIVGYQLLQREYINMVLSGSGDRILRFPVNNITACTSLEYRSTYSQWRPLPDYLFELDFDHRCGVVGIGSFTFSDGRNNWRASFTGGWTQDCVPGTIREAFFHEIKRFLDRRPDVLSDNIGGQSASGKSYLNLRNETYSVLRPYTITSF